MPFQPDAAAASTDVLAADGGGGRRSRTTALVVGAAALLVLVLAGGAALAAKLAGGGGAQPESVVPATAVAFAKIDLDPSAGQKLDAFRFINKFPAVDNRFNPDEDLVKTLLQIAHDKGELTDLDYEADVKPWLGKRMAFALLPASGGSVEPQPVVVVQVSDAAKAQAGLTKLMSSAGDGNGGFVISGDYAVIAASEALARSAASAAQQAPLAGNKRFTADLASLGEAGVAAAWFDMAGVTDLSLAAMSLSGQVPPPQLDLLAQQKKGRFATVLRFDGPALELAGHVFDLPNAPEPFDGPVTNHLGDLPDTTLAALSFNHPDRYVKSVLDDIDSLGADRAQVDAVLAMAREQLGLTLPDDLMTLLGSNLVVAVDREGVEHDPQIGARVVTKTVDALTIIDRLEQVLWQLTGSPFALPRDETDDGYVIASTPDYAAELVKGGNLGASPRFVAALPHADGADASMFVDVAELVDRRGSTEGLSAEALANLAPLEAFGATVTNEGDGKATYLLRLTTR